MFNFLSVFCNLISAKVLRISYFNAILQRKNRVNWSIILQGTHSSSKVEQKWKEDIKSHVFFSNGKTNFCSVLTAYFGKETFNVKKQEIDKEGRILILDVSVNHSEYILINLYNANTENEQINVFSNMFALLKKFNINPKRQIIMAGDFNLLFDSKLNVKGGNPTMKKKPLATLIEIKESYDLCIYGE